MPHPNTKDSTKRENYKLNPARQACEKKRHFSGLAMGTEDKTEKALYLLKLLKRIP